MSSLIVPIVEIESLTKVERADTLLVARFKGYGWQSVVKLGQFEVGDFAVFVPPDCILPEKIIDLEKVTYLRNEHGRTRTVKLRGELSEGILIPTDIFTRMGIRFLPLPGDNVAETLGIQKWEPPQPKYQQTGPKPKRDRPYNSKDFPKYVDIENIKNYWAIVQMLIAQGVKVRATEKIHGTNFRAGWVYKTKLNLWDRVKRLFGKFDPWVYTCGSRNVEMGIDKDHSTFYASLGKNIYQQIGRQIKPNIPHGYIVYGEIYGEGIQDLTYGVKGIDFVVFDIMESTTKEYLDFESVCYYVESWFGMDKFVPILYTGPLTEEVITSNTIGLSVLAEGNGVYHLREGCVITPLVEMKDPVLGRVILKSINPDYLTRKKGTEFK